MLSRDKRLPLDTWNQSGVQENVFEINFLRLIHLKIFPKEFHLTTCKEIEKRSLKPTGRRLFTQAKTQNQVTIPMPTFAMKPLTASSTMPVELPQSCMVGQQRQPNIGMVIQQIPKSTIVLGVENSMAKRMGSPRHVEKRRRRTLKFPEPANVQTPLQTGWHMQGR